MCCLFSHQIIPLLIAVVLFVGTVVLFWPAHDYAFINLDDNIYVQMNPHVQQGVTIETLKWAWKGVHENYWIPLSWMSFMIDTEIFGGGASGYHITNIILHAINVLLLFFLLQSMTGRMWASCCVAILFAIHPLRVESVVWITERKDVLSALFFFLALMAYVRFSKRKRIWSYLLVLLCLLLSLMSKPMMVTFPFLLLLLDIWPLQRVSFSQGIPWQPLRHLCIEKIPFFVLAFVFAGLTFWAQARVGSVYTLATTPLGFRLQLIPFTYGAYIWKTLCPTDLATVYSASQQLPQDLLFFAIAIFTGLTFVSIVTIKKQPWVAIGWFWFVGILFPLSGIVRVGTVYMANRFTYVATIGLYILLIWGTNALTKSIKRRTWVLVPTFMVIMIVLCSVTRWNMSFWKDNETLFRRDLALNPYNFVALNGLGSELAMNNNHEESLPYFYQALQVSPDYADAHRNLAVALVTLDREAEALPHFAFAMKKSHENVLLMSDYASALCKAGDYEQGLNLFAQALDMNPDALWLKYNAALANKKSGHPDQAIKLFSELTTQKPDHHEAHYHLAILLRKQQRILEANTEIDTALKLQPSVMQYVNLKLLWLSQDANPGEIIDFLKSALQHNPDAYDLYNNLAWMLATQKDSELRNSEEALAYAQQAVVRAPEENAALLDTLAACYAADGKYTQAIETAHKAIRMANEEERTNLVRKLALRLKLYEAGQAWIDE